MATISQGKFQTRILEWKMAQKFVPNSPTDNNHALILDNGLEPNRR